MKFQTQRADMIMPEDMDVWRISSSYVNNKILFPLVKLDKYFLVAQFGYDDLDNSRNFNDSELAQNRYSALLWCSRVLESLIRNSLFSVGKKAKKQFESYLDALELLEKYYPNLLQKRTNNLTKNVEHRINEVLFKKCFEILQEIRTNIPYTLNSAGLIFKKREDLNLDDIAKQIAYGG